MCCNHHMLCSALLFCLSTHRQTHTYTQKERALDSSSPSATAAGAWRKTRRKLLDWQGLGGVNTAAGGCCCGGCWVLASPERLLRSIMLIIMAPRDEEGALVDDGGKGGSASAPVPSPLCCSPGVSSTPSFALGGWGARASRPCACLCAMSSMWKRKPSSQGRDASSDWEAGRYCCVCVCVCVCVCCWCG